VYEREQEIEKFNSVSYFTLSAKFPSFPEIIAEYHNEFKTAEEVTELMPKLIKLTYELNKLDSKQHTVNPPPPYITSSIQQDASNKLGYSPKNTMMSLQKLYERGMITYMRTDSTTISANFQKEIQKWIEDKHPSLYQRRDHKKKVANAQEAHECIRPVDINIRHASDGFSSQEKKLYDLIWVRTVASQMKPCLTESTSYKWKAKDNYTFSFSLSKDIQLGFKTIYTGKADDDSVMINKLAKLKTTLKESPIELNSKEKFTKPPARFTEASLIKELEDLGIGRPSTYSNIIATLVDRAYVAKDSNNSDRRLTREFTLKGNEKQIKEEQTETTISSERNRLVLTPIGKNVCEFMNTNFDMIQSYDLTKDIEDELDEIANGNKSKTIVIDKMYKLFNPTVEKLMKETKSKENKKNDMSRHKLLGKHPKNKTEIYLYYGRFGPCIAEKIDAENMKFTSLPKDLKNQVVSLNDALALLEFPKKLGSHGNDDVILKNGPYGAYIEWGQTRVPLSKINKTIHDVELEDVIEALDNGDHSMTTLKEYSDGMKIMQNARGIYVKKNEKMVPIPDDKDWEKMKKPDLTALLATYVPKKRKFFPRKK
jgi:DNA topoisomerase-1